MYPVNQLTKQNVKFEWTPNHQRCVDLVITYIESAMLQLAPSGEVFRLETDASDVAVGAVLYDKAMYDATLPGEVCLPIKFLSRTLHPAERNWSTQERETWAIVWALDACANFVYGREVHVYCDHKNLPSMLNSATNGKLVRWAIRLAEYNPIIITLVDPIML